jgi:hypothetical protein
MAYDCQLVYFIGNETDVGICEKGRDWKLVLLFFFFFKKA